MNRFVIILIAVCAAGRVAVAETPHLPITEGSVPGYFCFSAGDDVQDAPASARVQIGDGREIFGISFAFDLPVQPRQQTLLPYVSETGALVFEQSVLDFGGIQIELTSQPTGSLQITGSQVHLAMTGEAKVAWPLADGTTFELTAPITITTGQASANADGLDKLLLFGNTRIDGTPFDCTTGAGAVAAAFTIPKDLPAEAVDQLAALLQGLGIGVDAAILLGAPVGIRVAGDLEANAIVAAPLIAPGSGTFEGSALVELTSETAGATIRYTTDGSPPTETSELFTSTFFLFSDATVRARAYRAGYKESAASAASFTVVPIPGDTNGDCNVNILDLIAVRNKLNADPASPPENASFDLNGDGSINILDMIFVRNRLNTTCPGAG